MAVRLIYFAWVRERIGKAEETIELPASVATVSDLIAHLRAQGDGYDTALQAPQAIRVAIDHEHVPHGAPLAGAREIALFPPMTGG
ncbi:MAG: molybdopterin converting factor subunit 1 [Pararhizobium sp.]